MPQTTPLSPAERQAWMLGRRCFERGEDDLALEQLRTLLHTRDGFADVHYMVGILHERREEPDEAARAFVEALRINPHYAEARLALASLYEREGDFRRSRELTTGLAVRGSGVLDPTTRGKLANLEASLGDAYREVGQLREAIETYRRALDRCPGFHDIRRRLAISLREAGQPLRALSELRRIQRAAPEQLDAAIQAGVTLYSLGRCDEAVIEWRGVLARAPEREDARMYLRLVGAEKPMESRG